MVTPDDSPGSRWKRVTGAALVLLVAAVLPSPLRRHAAFDRFGPDKFLHLLGHAWLTVTLADAFASHRLEAVPAGIVAALCSFGHGMVTGFFQQYVPGRVPERADLLAGVLGSVIGVLGWWYVSEARTVSPANDENQLAITENA